MSFLIGLGGFQYSNDGNNKTATARVELLPDDDENTTEGKASRQFSIATKHIVLADDTGFRRGHKTNFVEYVIDFRSMQM